MPPDHRDPTAPRAWLRAGGVEVLEGIRQTGELTEYAVEARYPGLFEGVTHEDYLQALDLAERVLAWVESAVVRGTGPE